MSTRANIVILYGSSKVYLYRHCDGYPAELGADLARNLASAGHSANKFVRSLVEARYEKASYETEAKPIYELTTEVHGDIEYLYLVKFEEDWHPTEKPQIGFAARRGWHDGSDLKLSDVRLGDLPTFVLAVNADIRAQNKRLGELRASQPQVYGDYGDQPEVVLQ